MLILRPTQKLAKRIGVTLGTGQIAPANLCADWSANDFQAGRRRYILFAHSWALVGCVAPARGITDPRTFLARFAETTAEQLRVCGLASIWSNRIEPQLGTISFAPMPSRSCMGCVNDLVRLASLHIEDGCSLEEINHQISDVPMVSADIGSPLKRLAQLAANSD